MRAWWATGLVLLILLSGCGGKDKLSDSDMEERAREALAGLRHDAGPAGELSGVEVSGWVKTDTEGPFGPVTLQVDVGATVAFGTASDIRMDGFMTKDREVTFESYCSPDRLVLVTHGLAKFGGDDVDTETRNLRDVCAGPGSEGLLTPVAEFELIDPDILTGNLRHDDLELTGFEQTGDGRFDVSYRNEAPLGATDLVVSIKGTEVQKILAENDDSRITMEMEYGERVAVESLEAARRLPSEVNGSEDESDDGWRWRGTGEEAGPWGDYIVHVFDPEANADAQCTSSSEAPIVAFPLADGKDQEKDGFRMRFDEDGDGKLGPGDTIFIHHPGNLGQEWDYDVEFYDTWAQSYSRYSCSIPGPAALPVLAVLALAAVVVRRRWL